MEAEPVDVREAVPEAVTTPDLELLAEPDGVLAPEPEGPLDCDTDAEGLPVSCAVDVARLELLAVGDCAAVPLGDAV